MVKLAGEEKWIPVTLIDPPRRPVRDVKRSSRDEMEESIKEDGMYHRIVVRPVPGGRYECAAGYHRYTIAIRQAADTGDNMVPCTVRTLSDEEAPLLSIAENIQRNTHLDPIAEGEVFCENVEKGWTVERIAKKIGKSKNLHYVYNRIRVYEQLHPKLQNQVSKGHLSFENAKAIAEQPMAKQLEIARKLKHYPKVNPANLSNLINTSCTHGCPTHCPPVNLE